MLTLSLDTTAAFGSIALLDGAETLSEILLHEPEGFSHTLFGQIEVLLERQGISLKDVGLYAAASGPGSFTGVRVGLSAVKAFAEVHRRPVIAVSNLLALATFGTSALRATIIDARRGEIYAALYDARCQAVIPEQVIAFPAFLAKLPQASVQWIATDFTPFQGPGRVDVVTAPRAQAAAIARVALALHDADERPYPPEAVDANYVRRSDAEILWKEY